MPRNMTDEELRKLGLEWKMEDLRAIKEEIAEERFFLTQEIDNFLQQLQSFRSRLADTSRQVEEIEDEMRGDLTVGDST